MTPSPRQDAIRPPPLPAGALVAVALTAVAAHLPALFNGFTNWDDDYYLTLNPLVLQLTPDHVWRYFTSFQLDNYHPLTLLAHALWHNFFGLSPLPHHALNIALHAANAVLVLLLAGALGAGRPGALGAALLFATHPLHVEVVAWTAQLKTLLSTLFFLAALLAYVRRLEGPARGFPTAALVLASCSLLAKPAAVPIPIVLLLIDHHRGRPIDRRALWEKAPFALLALASGALTLLAQEDAMRPTSAQPLSHAPFVAAHGILFLLAKAVAPFGLSALYPYPEAARGGLPWTFVAAPAALALLVAALWRTAARSRDALFGTLFFLTMLAPTLQVIPVGIATTADRYFYLPSIGLCFLAGRSIDRLFIDERSGHLRRAAGLALLMATLALGAICCRRALVWEGSVTLWKDVVDKYPDSMMAWGNLGQGLAAQGRLDQAEPAFARALTLAGNRLYRATILFNRAYAFQEAGDLGRALDDYTLGLEIKPFSAPVLVNRGNALDALGRPWDALNDYSLAISLDTENTLAWYNRGVTLAGLGDHVAAVESFDRALRLEPGYAPGYHYRAGSLEALGRLAEAAEDRRRAAQLGAGASGERRDGR